MNPLQQLYQRVDKACAKLAQRHQTRLACALGCTQCCVDDLTVFPVEADNIRTQAAEILQRQPAPTGACAFLSETGACRIYDHRPYVCRTQGLPLRWVEEDEDGDWLEYRDICPLNEEGEPIETLEEVDCWTLGPTEGELAALQDAHGGDATRIPLRSLFQTKDVG